MQSQYLSVCPSLRELSPSSCLDLAGSSFQGMLGSYVDCIAEEDFAMNLLGAKRHNISTKCQIKQEPSSEQYLLLSLRTANEKRVWNVGRVEWKSALPNSEGKRR